MTSVLLRFWHPNIWGFQINYCCCMLSVNCHVYVVSLLSKNVVKKIVTGLSVLICLCLLYILHSSGWEISNLARYSALNDIISGSKNERIFTAIFPVYFEIIYKTLFKIVTNACVIGLFSSSCPLAWPLGCSKSITKHWIDLYASSNCQMI